MSRELATVQAKAGLNFISIDARIKLDPTPAMDATCSTQVFRT